MFFLFQMSISASFVRTLFSFHRIFSVRLNHGPPTEISFQQRYVQQKPEKELDLSSSPRGLVETRNRAKNEIEHLTFLFPLMARNMAAEGH